MADTTLLRFVTSSRPLLLGIIALLLGQILFLFDLGVLYVAALVFTMAVGLPYPKILNSLMARLVAGFLLALSIVQVAATAQFFALPRTDFAALSLIVTALTLVLLFALRNIPRQPLRLWDTKDIAGLVVALFFVLPLGVLTFGQNHLTRIATLASVQGSDGGSHYTILGQMSNTQHLDYHNAEYYPKGFHLASAFLMHGLHINQHDQDWSTNARVYAGTYLAWGAVAAYVLLYVAAQMRESLPNRKRPSLLLLALGIGPALSGIYLFTLTQEGFLSFFYIIAVLACGLIYLYDLKPSSALSRWHIIAYLLLAFGLAMSWGPLLTPVLLAIPLLYLWSSVGNIKTLLRMAVSKQWMWVTLAFALQLVPLYLHLRYATLSPEQGLNATGGLKEFHYGVIAAGLALVVYLLCSRTVPAHWQRFTSNALLPLLVLTGGFVAFQLVTVGEVRYYGIKISYLFEALLVVAATVTLTAVLHERSLATWQRWVVLPLAVGLGFTLLIGFTTNPFERVRIVVGNLAHIERGNPDIRHYAELGASGQLYSNTVALHYNPGSDTLMGNARLTNWGHLMQYTTDNTPQTGLCNGRIFTLQTYRAPDAQQTEELIAAVKDCIAAAKDRGRPYVIVTDADSAPRLRDHFGDTAKYIY